MKLKLKIIQKTWIVLGLLLLVAASAFAKDQARNNYVPATISVEAQQALKAIYDARAYAQVFPAADDLAGWRKTHADGEQGKIKIGENAVASNKVTVSEGKLGGVPVLDIRPSGWKDNGKVLVYTHGGAYTMFSARKLRSHEPGHRLARDLGGLHHRALCKMGADPGAGDFGVQVSVVFFLKPDTWHPKP